MKAWFLPVFLLVLAAGLEAQRHYGATGTAASADLVAGNARQAVANERLRRENAILMADVVAMRDDPSAVEHRARSELGFIKPGEVFYMVVDEP